MTADAKAHDSEAFGPTGEPTLEASNWFFQNSPDLFIVTDFAGAIQQVNRAWTDRLGLEAEDVLGRTLPELVHPDDRDQLRESGETLRREGEARHTFRILCKSDGFRWVEGFVRVTARRELVGVLRDITEDRQRDIELQQLRQAGEMLTEAAGVSTWTFDPVAQRIVLSAHRRDQIRAISGDPDVQAVEAFARLVHPDDVEELDRRIREASVHGQSGEVTYRLRAEEGGWRSYRLTYRPEAHPGGLFYVHGLAQDITELAAARDAAIAGAEAKARFLANMSHEIRTPMNGVMGVLQLLKAEPLDGPARQLLDEALTCGRMLAELLNDVVDFSKIEEGRLELKPEPLDPTDLLDSVVSLLRPQADAKGLWLRADSPAEAAWAELDPVRLRQALFNLIGNAVKFTSTGGVDVRLRTIDGGADRRLRFEVKDTGPGIPHDAQARLFQRFSQADASTTRQFGGSGLGLAITRRLAEMMAGEVGLTSEPDQGSTFWLEIAAPVIATPLPAAEGLGDSTAASGSGLAGLRVLVVDDNATNRMILSRLLEAMDVEVTTADGGEQALSAARRGGFDVILMDVQMPGMDGLQATRLIRASPGPVAQVPILAVTADALVHQRNAFEAAGMNGMVSKPIVASTLYDAVVAAAAGPFLA